MFRSIVTFIRRLFVRDSFVVVPLSRYADTYISTVGGLLYVDMPGLRARALLEDYDYYYTLVQDRLDDLHASGCTGVRYSR